jgi:DNA-binding beta-propeller fold protein YncE
MMEPIFVINDAHGNIYEVDSGNPNGVGGNDGFVNEYAPMSNPVLRTCAPGAHPTGIAIDGKGDVSSRSTAILPTAALSIIRVGSTVGKESTSVSSLGSYRASRSTRGSTSLRLITIVARSSSLPPPYAKVARRLQHGGPDSEPYHVSIDGSNSLVYVTNYSKPGVFVVDYKSGKVLRKVDGDGGRSTVLTRLLDRPLPQL